MQMSLTLEILRFIFRCLWTTGLSFIIFHLLLRHCQGFGNVSQEQFQKHWYWRLKISQPSFPGWERLEEELRCAEEVPWPVHTLGCSVRPFFFVAFSWSQDPLTGREVSYCTKHLIRPHQFLVFFGCFLILSGLVFFACFKKAVEVEVVILASLGGTVHPTSTGFYCW